MVKLVIAEHYEVLRYGKRFCVCDDRQNAENIAKVYSGTIRTIPAKVIGV